MPFFLSHSFCVKSSRINSTNIVCPKWASGNGSTTTTECNFLNKSRFLRTSRRFNSDLEFILVAMKTCISCGALRFSAEQSSAAISILQDLVLIISKAFKARILCITCCSIPLALIPTRNLHKANCIKIEMNKPVYLIVDSVKWWRIVVWRNKTLYRLTSSNPFTNINYLLSFAIFCSVSFSTIRLCGKTSTKTRYAIQSLLNQNDKKNTTQKIRRIIKFLSSSIFYVGLLLSFLFSILIGVNLKRIVYKMY